MHSAKMVLFQRHSATASRPGAKPARFVYTYRCCDDPRTDSTLSIGFPWLLDRAEVARLRAVHAANVESKHEAKVAAEAQLRSQLGLGIVIMDSASGTHVCRLVAVEHAADEIIRVRYQCCGGKDPADLHVAEIDRIHWHTPEEIKAFVVEHIKDAADHCAGRALAAEEGTYGRTRGEAGTAL